MIWLKQDEKVVGYVPILKKEYSEEEIWKMNKYYPYQGWSELSKIVMQVQGIRYINADPYNYYENESKRLVDVNFDFAFTFLEDNSKYISQIFEVFENLRLCKIEEYSEIELEEKISKVTKELEHFVSKRTLEELHDEVENTLINGENSYIRLCDLQNLFSDKGYKLSHSLFEEADERLKSQIYKERTIETELVMEYH